MGDAGATTLRVDFIDAARLLAQLQEDDPETFHTVAKSLGIGRRKAYYLVGVAKALEGVPVSKERLTRIGWTKLQLLGPYLTASNSKTLIAQAEAHTVRQLRALLQKEGLPAQTHCVLFYLSNTQFDLLATVLEAFGAKRQGKTIRGKETALVAAMSKLAELHAG